jgi:hypothetical protein
MKGIYYVRWLSPFNGEQESMKCTCRKGAESVAERVAYTGANAAIVCEVGGKPVSMRMVWATK